MQSRFKFANVIPCALRRLMPAMLQYLAVALVTGFIANPAAGQAETKVGTIVGTVRSQVADATLERARVVVEGTNRETFTNAFGEYRLLAIQAGDVRVRVFYTGMAPETVSVRVVSEEEVKQDFVLSAVDSDKSVQGEKAIQMDAFKVSTARETSAAAIAINEQRFSLNAKSVISTDALGIVGDNNAGEFVKSLPGVDVNTNEAYALSISLRGLPAQYTNISMDGEVVNSASSTSPSRTTFLQTISLANTNRIEVFKVPTPDMPASSLGGSVNLISRSAFEAAKPEFTFRTFSNFNSRDFSLGPRYLVTRGDSGEKLFAHAPLGFNATYVLPLSKTLGFSANASFDDKFYVSRRISRTFSTSTAASNPLVASVGNPYLSGLSYLRAPPTSKCAISDSGPIGSRRLTTLCR